MVRRFFVAITSSLLLITGFTLLNLTSIKTEAAPPSATFNGQPCVVNTYITIYARNAHDDNWVSYNADNDTPTIPYEGALWTTGGPYGGHYLLNGREVMTLVPSMSRAFAQPGQSPCATVPAMGDIVEITPTTLTRGTVTISIRTRGGYSVKRAINVTSASSTTPTTAAPAPVATTTQPQPTATAVQTPLSINFTVNGSQGPITVDSGGSATLSWTVSGANSSTRCAGSGTNAPNGIVDTNTTIASSATTSSFIGQIGYVGKVSVSNIRGGINLKVSCLGNGIATASVQITVKNQVTPTPTCIKPWWNPWASCTTTPPAVPQPTFSAIPTITPSVTTSTTTTPPSCGSGQTLDAATNRCYPRPSVSATKTPLAPTILTIVPASVVKGSQVTITGSGFSSSDNTITLTDTLGIVTTLPKISSVNGMTIPITIPAQISSGVYTVSMQNSSGVLTSKTQQLTVTSPYISTGTYTTSTINAPTNTELTGNISVLNLKTPAGTKIEFQIGAVDTEGKVAAWIPITTVDSTVTSTNISIPKISTENLALKRSAVKLKAILSTTDNSKTPSFSGFKLLTVAIAQTSISPSASLSLDSSTSASPSVSASASSSVSPSPSPSTVTPTTTPVASTSAPIISKKASDFHAQFVSQNAYPTLRSGGSNLFEVTLRNTGTASWIKGSVNLGTDRSQDRIPRFIREDVVGHNTSGWISSNRVQMVQDRVDPGQEATFRFYYTVPTTLPAGVYHEYFRPVAEGVAWLENMGIYWDVTVTK